MDEAFQQALKAQDLEAIRKVPKTDLHNHGVAGADPASVEEILGRRFTPLDHKLTSMAEMHAWASENLGNINPKLGPRLLEAAFARATWDSLVRYELGDDVWSITVHGSAENVTQRLKKAHARGAPKVEWIPQPGISRHCRIEDIRRWMDPFLSGFLPHV